MQNIFQKFFFPFSPQEEVIDRIGDIIVAAEKNSTLDNYPFDILKSKPEWALNHYDIDPADCRTVTVDGVTICVVETPKLDSGGSWSSFYLYVKPINGETTPIVDPGFIRESLIKKIVRSLNRVLEKRAVFALQQRLNAAFA